MNAGILALAPLSAHACSSVSNPRACLGRDKLQPKAAASNVLLNFSRERMGRQVPGFQRMPTRVGWQCLLRNPSRPGLLSRFLCRIPGLTGDVAARSRRLATEGGHP